MRWNSYYLDSCIIYRKENKFVYICNFLQFPDAERSVGSVNYELKIRGAKNLKTVSANHVIAKSSSLTAGKVPDNRFREMERKKVLPGIVEAWDKRQSELSEKGLSEKELQNVSTDRRRNSDLHKLRNMGGPFTTAEEVKQFATSNVSEEEKVSRLYLEVRYARDSSISFPKNSDIFRLKRQFRNLDSKTYADNLVVFLDKITFQNNVEMKDFDEALRCLS